MTDDKNKDIVEEVFGRSMKADDRVSALFKCVEQPSQVSPGTVENRPCDLNGSPPARETVPPGNEQFQSAKGVDLEIPSKATNKKSGYRAMIIAAVGSVLFGSIFIAGRYFIQDGNASTEMMPESQYVNHSETVSPPERPALPNVESEPIELEPVEPGPVEPEPIELEPVEPENIEPEPALEKININRTALDWQPVIDWSRLLSEISATIPTTMHLSVIESADGSEMFLEGAALSADAIYSFIDSLGDNRQVESAELAKTGTDQRDSQNLLTFSISCSLVSDTKTPGSVDGDNNDSVPGSSRLFTPKEAKKFFGSITPVSEYAGCSVKSLLVSPKDIVFEDEKTNIRITKKHVVLTILGGYRDILKVAENLQDHSQYVWIDSVSIKQGGETGGLECSMGISVYVADSPALDAFLSLLAP